MFKGADSFLIIPCVFLTGAAFIMFLYHLFLYLQAREKVILKYCIYLFAIFIYLPVDLFNKEQVRLEGLQGYDYLADAFNFLVILSYASFLMEVAAQWRNQYKKLYRTWDIVAGITMMYSIFLFLLFATGIRSISEATNIGAYAVRMMLVLVGIWATIVLFPKLRNDRFRIWIKWGALIYLFFMGLVLITALTPERKLLGMSPMHFVYLGTLADIFIFSFAMSIKVKEALLKASEVSSLSKDLQLQRQQEQFTLQLQQQKEKSMVADFNKQLAEVQLTALSAQMNPHFIFNCMNSIQKYVLKNEKSRALAFLQNFSELMRSVLDNSAKSKISLDDEIGMLEKYILLEQQRLENKFDYRIEVSPDLQTDFFELPGMIIQPYVENAIWHGLMNLPDRQAGLPDPSNGTSPGSGIREEKGTLLLQFLKEDAIIKCVIEDNGVGRKKAGELQKDKSPHRKSYGMTIARKRLELLRKEEQDVPEIIVDDLFDNDGCSLGTRVTIFIHGE